MRRKNKNNDTSNNNKGNGASRTASVSPSGVRRSPTTSRPSPFRQRRRNQPAQLVLSQTPLLSYDNDSHTRRADAYAPTPLTAASESSSSSSRRPPKRWPQSASVSPVAPRNSMTPNSAGKSPNNKLDIPSTITTMAATPPLGHITSTNLSSLPGRGGTTNSTEGVVGWEARRHSSVFARRGTTSLHFHGGSLLDLGDRTGSKLTLDEELFDILYAFGEADAAGDGEAEEEEEADEKRGKPMTRQYLLNKIRQKKEVINKLRCQPWSMNRKRRTLRLAQKYLEQNESKVSRAHLYKEELVKRWRAFLRWASNIGIYLIPWESKIKKIESQFGSVVSSYFTFLRWVIFMNLILTLIIATLIVIPEFLADATADEARRNRTFTRKEIPAEEKPHADEIQVVWHYGGYLRYSPLFYGYYANEHVVGKYFSYPLPLAYFLGTLVVFAFSFMAILRKMASNARMSKLAGSKTEQYIFNWKVFTGWDYSIGNAETASNTAMAAVIKLRETINECHAEQSKRIRPIQVIIRIVTNLVILGMIAFSIYCIHAAVQSSEAVEQTGSGSLLTKNQELDEGVLFPKSSILPQLFFSRNFTSEAQFHARVRYGESLASTAATAASAALHRRAVTRQFVTASDAISLIRVFSPPNIAMHGAGGWHLAGRKTKLESWSRRKRQTNGGDDEIAVVTSRNASPRGAFFSASFSVPPSESPSTATASVASSSRATTSDLSSPIPESAYLPSSTTSKIRWRPSTSSPKATAATTKGMISGQTEMGTSSGTTGPGPNAGTVTVDGSRVRINAQFGPVGVNNPTALMRNATVAPSTLPAVGYETRRLGPTPLPVFTPPPLPPTDAQPTFRKHDWGPDWSISTKERTEFPSISFGDVVNLDTVSYSELNDKDLQSGEDDHSYNNGSTVAVISSEVGDQGHYNDHICWETVIGQEIVKLVTMDLYYTIVSILVIDFFRGYWIRYCSSWWCWDIETTFPEYGEFKVAENVLHIINNQGMIWLGLFFAPLLPAVNNVKLIIIMYIRAWACMTCNVPAREIFRASRSSNFFLMILLLWLLLCTLPVGYVITSKRPSTICGPFAGKDQFYEVITKIIEANVSKKVIRWLKYVASPGVIIPIILLLMLIIFFLVSLVRGLREANTDLQKQLVHERTEEKKKIFELAGGGKQKKPAGSFLSKFHPKKPVQHIPEVERKRREPWRQYNGTDRAASLCPSDEPASAPLSESSDSPMSPTTSSRPPLPQQRQRLRINDPELGGVAQPLPPTRSGYAFRPSSVDEGDSARSSNLPGGPSKFGAWPAPAERPGHDAVNNYNKMSKSLTDRATTAVPGADDLWLPDNEATHSDNSDDAAAASDTPFGHPAMASTPEDLRSFILPFLEPRKFHAGDSITSLAAFPKDASNPIIFGTCIATGGGSTGGSGGVPSRRSSAAAAIAARPPSNASCLSLYENAEADALSPPLSQMQSQNVDKMTTSDTGNGNGALTQWNPRYSKVWRHQYSLAAALPPRPPPSSTSATSISQYAALLRANRNDAPSAGRPAMSRSGTFPSGFGSNRGEADAAAVTVAMARSFVAHPHATTIPPGGKPAPETQQRISIYAKEPRRIGQMSVQQTELSGSRINTTVNVHTPALVSKDADASGATTVSKTDRRATTTANVQRTSRRDNPPKGANHQRHVAPPLAESRPSTSSAYKSDRQKSTSPSKSRSPSKKFNPTEMSDTFMPWPSIEEVKAQHANFFQSPDKSKSRSSRGSPPKLMAKSAHGALAPERPNRMQISDTSEQEAAQPTRFRISVSPTRRLRPDHDSNSEEEVDVSDNGRRPVGNSSRYYNTGKPSHFVVKQQLLPGSTSSFGSRLSTETTAALKAEVAAQAAAHMAAATASAKASRRQAPKIEFGEDDSPRVELPPKMP